MHIGIDIEMQKIRDTVQKYPMTVQTGHNSPELIFFEDRDLGGSIIFPSTIDRFVLGFAGLCYSLEQVRFKYFTPIVEVSIFCLAPLQFYIYSQKIPIIIAIILVICITISEIF